MTTLQNHPLGLTDVDRWRPATLAAGPVGLVALAAFISSIIVYGDDELALVTATVSIAASVAGLACLGLLAVGMVSLAFRVPQLRQGAGLIGWCVAAFGTVLGAGGQWAQLFVLPGLAEAAPQVALAGLETVLTGYIVSYLVMAAGWLLVGVTLLRAGAAKLGSWLTIIGAVTCIAPLPVRFFLLAIGVSLVANSIHRARLS